MLAARVDAAPLGGAHAGLRSLLGLSLTLALHALVFIGVLSAGRAATDVPGPGAHEPQTLLLYIQPPKMAQATRQPQAAPQTPARPAPSQQEAAPSTHPAETPSVPRQPAMMAAPPAPTPEEWAFASTYKLKNSKGYRYTWGQQVRSMMGTAVEGPDQGMVRFLVEIAPDGRLTRLETLWSTSPAAERLARQAVRSMPQWPPTPTGKPLVFEKTISFSPFAADGPPLYRNDCLPDKPGFSNPFAWDGRSARETTPPQADDKADPEALEDCLKQLPKDSIEAEVARDRRVMERWGWSASQPRR